MRRSVSILILALVLGIAALGNLIAFAGGISIHQQEKLTMAVTSTGDTAKVMLGEITIAKDTFLYQCTTLVAYNGAAVDTAVAAWTSGPHRIKFTPTTVMDSFLYIDTVITASGADSTYWEPEWTSNPYTMNITPEAHDSYDYSIKFVFDSSDATPDTLAVEFTTATSMSVAEVCDSIVSVGEAATTITDSVTFHDSATYVKVFSNFGSETMDRFVLYATDSDSSGAFTISPVTNTVAMTCDSMTAYINAEAGLTDSLVAEDSATYYVIKTLHGTDTLVSSFWKAWPKDTAQDTATTFAVTIAMAVDSMVSAINTASGDWVTASNSGDTGFLVTSDYKGMTFGLSIGDTVTDTSVAQANVIGTAIIGKTDTIGISPLLYRDFSTRSVQARFILNAPTGPTPLTGYNIGAADSGYLQLFTEWAGTWDLLGKDSTASLPCTLYYVLPSAAGTDTLFEEKLMLIYRVRDSVLGLDDTLRYKLHYDVLLKGE